MSFRSFKTQDPESLIQLHHPTLLQALKIGNYHCYIKVLCHDNIAFYFIQKQ